jgi:hypothetical protein
MRSKKEFIFNEYEQAEKIVLNGFENGIIDYSQMYSVAKYFRETMGYGKIRLEREIIKFCKNQDRNFNPVIDSEAIKKWVNSAMKYNLRQINKVTLTEQEINFLKKIQKESDRKLLFCTLVLSKGLKRRGTKVDQEEYETSDKYYIKYRNLGDIIKMSRLTNISEMKLAEILHNYKKHFFFYNPEKELIRIEFAEHKEGKYIIDNLKNPIENYKEIFK